MLVEQNRNLDLRHALELAAAVQPLKIDAGSIDEVISASLLYSVYNFIYVCKQLKFEAILSQFKSMRLHIHVPLILLQVSVSNFMVLLYHRSSTYKYITFRILSGWELSSWIVTCV